MYRTNKAKRYYLAACAVDAGFNTFSCNALALVVGEYQHPLAHEYSDLFKPDDADGRNAWGQDWSMYERERKECRIMALLFMAAIVEDQP